MSKLDLNYIRDFIIKGKVDSALEELFNILQSSSKLHGRLRDDVIILQTQLHELKRKQNLRLISTEEANLEHAQLQNAILDVINSLEQPSRVAAVSAPPASRRLPAWFVPVLLAVVAVVLAILFRDVFTGQGDPSTPPLMEPADVYVAHFELNPPDPVAGQETEMHCVIHNRGAGPAENFRVEWWIGPEEDGPAKTWRLSLGPGEERELHFSFPGFPPSPRHVETRLVLDPERRIPEENLGDNTHFFELEIRSRRPAEPGSAKKDPPPDPSPIHREVDLDFSGLWHTPDQGLNYEVTQQGDEYTWTVRGTQVSAAGRISGRELIGRIGEAEVVYTAVLVSEEDPARPLVLFTEHPNYAGVIMFRECADYQRFLRQYQEEKPNFYRLLIDLYLSKVPNPRCPEVTF